MCNEIIVFIGQNASTGTPNANTGRMSSYGRLYKFNDRSKAVEFAEEHDTGSADCIAEVGTRRTIRKHCLGQSVHMYNQDLDCIDFEEGR